MSLVTLIHFLQLSGNVSVLQLELNRSWQRLYGTQSLKYYLAIYRKSLQTPIKKHIKLEMCKHLEKKKKKKPTCYHRES